ncbi:MAG TPA: methyl-accepting chemotaxis protein [Bacillota bacterium]
MIKKPLQSLQKVLSKISVFYQIIFIIILMIGFMVGQSINSSRAMNMIQQNTKKIYDNTAGISQQDNIDIEINVEKIRGQYLALLANESLSGSPYQVFNVNTLFNKIKARKYIDDSTNKRLDEIFSNIKAILEKPVNSRNFTALSREVDNLQSVLRYIRNASSSVNYNLYLDSESFAAQLEKSNTRLVTVGVVCITLIGLLIAFSVYYPLKKIVQRVQSLGAGDLSQSMIDVTGSYEAAEAIKGLNRAITGLRSLVAEISKQSLTIDNASSELSTISAETGVLATEVAKSANELAAASSEQVRQITEAINSIQELSDTVIQVTRDSQRIGQASNEVAQSAELGRKVTSNVATEISALYDSTQNVADAINVLLRSSEEISGITSIIEGIAERTGLLALNASIEAARAGEHGKGFAVVAREVAKLAERSKQSARSIAELIEEMKSHTDQTVQVMRHEISRAEAGKNLAEQAVITFEEINKTLMNTIAEINLIVKSTEQMAALNEKATDAISAISAISEQNLASTEEVSAVTEEQSAAMAQVTTLANNLRKIAGDLKQAVEMFELG